MEEVTNFSEHRDKPVHGDEMPFLLITCGEKGTKASHGKIEIARFFDSRYEQLLGYGRSLPRLDVPSKSHTDRFTWDSYRIDIGPTLIIPTKNSTNETRAATGFKSGERVWDTPEKIWLECRKQVSQEGRNGEIVKSQCKKRTQISKEDWNDVGMILLQNDLVKQGERYVEIDWNFLFQLVNGVKKSRKGK
jgi:hypothetical protein